MNENLQDVQDFSKQTYKYRFQDDKVKSRKNLVYWPFAIHKEKSYRKSELALTHLPTGYTLSEVSYRDGLDDIRWLMVKLAEIDGVDSQNPPIEQIKQVSHDTQSPPDSFLEFEIPSNFDSTAFLVDDMWNAVKGFDSVQIFNFTLDGIMFRKWLALNRGHKIKVSFETGKFYEPYSRKPFEKETIVFTNDDNWKTRFIDQPRSGNHRIIILNPDLR